MASDALKAFFRFGVMIIVLSACVLLVQRPGTPEFVVTVMSLIIGLILVALVALVVRRIQ